MPWPLTTKAAPKHRLYLRTIEFRIGRVCVKKEMRGMHIGDFVMRMLLYRAQQLHAGSVTLSAQADKLDFYRRYGFQPYGELVYDEGPAPSNDAGGGG